MRLLNLRLSRFFADSHDKPAAHRTKVKSLRKLSKLGVLVATRPYCLGRLKRATPILIESKDRKSRAPPLPVWGRLYRLTTAVVGTVKILIALARVA